MMYMSLYLILALSRTVTSNSSGTVTPIKKNKVADYK
jgi:hypothetical protein